MRGYGRLSEIYKKGISMSRKIDVGLRQELSAVGGMWTLVIREISGFLEWNRHGDTRPTIFMGLLQADGTLFQVLCPVKCKNDPSWVNLRLETCGLKPFRSSA
jgi:hypothetical protein